MRQLRRYRRSSRSLRFDCRERWQAEARAGTRMLMSSVPRKPDGENHRRRMGSEDGMSGAQNKSPPKHTHYAIALRVPMAPCYAAMPDGTILSTTSNWRGYGVREMRQKPNTDGYPSVRIVINGKRTRISVHRLVASAYLPPRPSPKHEIRHFDGDKTNNHHDNLRWGTRKDNADDRQRHGRTSRGCSHSAAIKKSDHRKMVRRGRHHYKARAAISKATGTV